MTVSANSSTADVWLDSSLPSILRYCKCKYAGRLQVLGNCGRRLVYREVVEAQSNKITAWGDSTGSNRIETYRVRVPPGLAGGGEKRAVWFIMCEAPSDDWTNGGSVDVFFTYDMVLVLWGVGPILGNGYGI